MTFHAAWFPVVLVLLLTFYRLPGVGSFFCAAKELSNADSLLVGTKPFVSARRPKFIDESCFAWFPEGEHDPSFRSPPFEFFRVFQVNPLLASSRLSLLNGLLRCLAAEYLGLDFQWPTGLEIFAGSLQRWGAQRRQLSARSRNEVSCSGSGCSIPCFWNIPPIPNPL